MNLDPSTIIDLVRELGGDHAQAAQQLQGMGHLDTQQHAGLLQGLGLDPRQLENGGCQNQQQGFGQSQQDDEQQRFGGQDGNQQQGFGQRGF